MHCIVAPLFLFVAALFLLYHDIMSLCHDKDCSSPLYVVGNYVTTLFYFTRVFISLHNTLCHDIG